MSENAKPGRMSPLMGMEHAFFTENQERLRTAFEARVQKLVADWEATAGQVRELRRKRKVKIRIVTFYGMITLKIRKGRGREGGWSHPATAFLGLRPNQWYSPEMEQRLAVFSVESGSYEKAERLAECTWLTASDDAVRALVQRLAETAANNPPPLTCNGAAGQEDTLIVMADGWNARHRGANWGRDKSNRVLPERVHWHEIRSAVIFKLSALLAVSGKRKAIMDKHVVAVPADTSPLDFGIRLKEEMIRMGYLRAKNVFFVMDGGVWLWNIFSDRFQQCSKGMLDFYHLSQHLNILGVALHGGDERKVREWCGKILHDLKHKSNERLFKTLDGLLSEPPADSPATLKVINEQEAYFRKHKTHMDYAINAAQGVPIGSGSVESLCSQFQNRLKRTGQFWTKDGFAAILQLIVRHWNGELDSLWQSAAA
jgi:hypothetical protein